MSKLKKTVFYLGTGLLFTHELDAAINKEWLVLPLTSWLSDELGQSVFLLAHVPLYAVLTALIASRKETVRKRARFLISLFLIIHGILHLAFMSHEYYEFESIESGLLIYGGALCGAVYLFLNQMRDGRSAE